MNAKTNQNNEFLKNLNDEATILIDRMALLDLSLGGLIHESTESTLQPQQLEVVRELAIIIMIDFRKYFLGELARH